MHPFKFHQFICRSDNYGVLLHDANSGSTAAIDAPDATAIEAELDRLGWTLTDIFTTHHHIDHVEGNLALKQRYGCQLTGPRTEAGKIPGIDHQLAAGDTLTWVGADIQILDCPGHTLGHIAYVMPSQNAVFAGDTLFSLGCGRVFEGSLAQMYQSVRQFKMLAPHLRLYCGHEYTKSNARFALSVEPENMALQKRAAEVDALLAEGKMTCPSTLSLELATNPFLRTESEEIRRNIGLPDAPDEEVFAELRRRKDSFR